MNRFILCLSTLSILQMGTAQQVAPGAAIIEARQAEVPALAKMLYGIDLQQGTWTHSQADICPAFTHHVFARYTRTDAAGNGSSFLAVYDLDTPAAPSLSKPWQGGILLVPLQGMARGVPLESHGTMLVFNRVLADEQRRSAVASTPDWGALAACYIALGGEQPLQPVSDLPQDQRPDPEPLPVSSILIPLVTAGPKSRTVGIHFDKRGFVTDAVISVSPV